MSPASRSSHGLSVGCAHLSSPSLSSRTPPSPTPCTAGAGAPRRLPSRPVAGPPGGVVGWPARPPPGPKPGWRPPCTFFLYIFRPKERKAGFWRRSFCGRSCSVAERHSLFPPAWNPGSTSGAPRVGGPPSVPRSAYKEVEFDGSDIYIHERYNGGDLRFDMRRLPCEAGSVGSGRVPRQGATAGPLASRPSRSHPTPSSLHKGEPKARDEPSEEGTDAPAIGPFVLPEADPGTRINLDIAGEGGPLRTGASARRAAPRPRPRR